MALVKRRIMSRGRVVAIMTDSFENRSSTSLYSSDERSQAHADSLLHMLADGKDVKIYNDVNLGGMVVEYDDGN